jgi:hypothetical protein
MSVGCSLTGWSAVNSALANSTLAAVLAGFMINGIILLLSRKPTQMSPRYVQALSLLFAAFVVLGLDAYLFGLVTGDSMKIIACRRIWTEAMFAAGLLAIGSVAIIVGFVLLFDAFFKDVMKGQPESEWRASLKMLESLCNAIRGGVAVATIVLLYLTVRSYLLAVFDDKVPILAELFIRLYLYVGVYGGIIAIAVVTFLAPNRISRWLMMAEPHQFIRTLKLAIISAVGYSVTACFAAASAASWPADEWNPAYPLVRLVIGATVVWVSMVTFVPIFLLLARTIPDFATEHRKATALQQLPEPAVDKLPLPASAPDRTL